MNQHITPINHYTGLLFRAIGIRSCYSIIPPVVVEGGPGSEPPPQLLDERGRALPINAFCDGASHNM